MDLSYASPMQKVQIESPHHGITVYLNNCKHSVHLMEEVSQAHVGPRLKLNPSSYRDVVECPAVQRRPDIADSAALESLSQLLSQYHTSSSKVVMDSNHKFALHEAAREGRSETLTFFL